MRLLRPRPQTNPALRIFCFPHAGGSAAIFAKWIPHLPPDVELLAFEYPGHGSRFKEPANRDLGLSIADAHGAIAPYLTRPFVFFGHSMGALVAYEVAARLLQMSSEVPHRIFLSARSAPHTLAHDAPSRSTLPVDELVKLMVELGGSPPAIVNNDELVKLFLPTIRADLHALETWRSPSRRLPVAFSLLGGLADREAPWPNVMAWQDRTTLPAAMHPFEGGHFYVLERYPEIIDIILNAAASGPGLPSGR